MALMLFLLVISIICLVFLALDMKHKIHLLKQEVARLEASQVLLMVPDDQAKALADWLANHPDETAALLKLAKPGDQTRLELRTDELDAQVKSPLSVQSSSLQVPMAMSEFVGEVAQTPENSSEPKSSDKQTLEQVAVDVAPLMPVVTSENPDGVKVIVLPHGGIRVTTREDK